MNWHDKIVSDKKVLLGKPTIKGTRLSVEFIIERLASGGTEEQLLENYPRLSREDLQAVFGYISDCFKDGLMYELSAETVGESFWRTKTFRFWKNKIMLTVKGRVENGAVLPLEPISDFYEGKEVIMTLADEQPINEDDDWRRLFTAIEENQIDVNITDLAHQHDHYLYCTPKRDYGAARKSLCGYGSFCGNIGQQRGIS